jgi:hypothetical protein
MLQTARLKRRCGAASFLFASVPCGDYDYFGAVYVETFSIHQGWHVPHAVGLSLVDSCFRRPLSVIPFLLGSRDYLDPEIMRPTPPNKSLQAIRDGGPSSPAGAGRLTLAGPACLSSGR